jgi:hypothetical protein
MFSCSRLSFYPLHIHFILYNLNGIFITTVFSMSLATQACGNGYHSLHDVELWTPWGVLPTGPAAATTEVEEDIDGRPLGGCYL